VRSIRATALAVAAISAVSVLAGVPAAQAAPEKPIINVGHRGASGHEPEHTFAAYDKALEMGADYIEQDLQQTSDGTLVVLHDSTLDRTTDCTGPVSAITLAELEQCDAGNGQRVPTLREVFERYGHRVNYYIETKTPEAADQMEERLLALLEEFNLREPAVNRWQVLIQSFSPESLQQIHEIDPDLPLIQLGGSRATLVATLPQIAEYAIGIGPSGGQVDATLTAAAHAVCVDVHPYTINTTAQMQALLDAGVDGMFTNFPDRLDALLGAEALPGPTAAILSAQANRRCRG
jgi:glycerophosphoryl diester phosphodiesterase